MKVLIMLSEFSSCTGSKFLKNCTESNPCGEVMGTMVVSLADVACFNHRW